MPSGFADRWLIRMNSDSAMLSQRRRDGAHLSFLQLPSVVGGHVSFVPIAGTAPL